MNNFNAWEKVLADITTKPISHTVVVDDTKTEYTILKGSAFDFFQIITKSMDEDGVPDILKTGALMLEEFVLEIDDGEQFLKSNSIGTVNLLSDEINKINQINQ